MTNFWLNDQKDDFKVNEMIKKVNWKIKNLNLIKQVNIFWLFQYLLISYDWIRNFQCISEPLESISSWRFGFRRQIWIKNMIKSQFDGNFCWNLSLSRFNGLSLIPCLETWISKKIQRKTQSFQKFFFAFCQYFVTFRL